MRECEALVQYLHLFLIVNMCSDFLIFTIASYLEKTLVLHSGNRSALGKLTFELQKCRTIPQTTGISLRPCCGVTPSVDSQDQLQRMALYPTGGISCKFSFFFPSFLATAPVTIDSSSLPSLLTPSFFFLLIEATISSHHKCKLRQKHIKNEVPFQPTP